VVEERFSTDSAYWRIREKLVAQISGVRYMQIPLPHKYQIVADEKNIPFCLGRIGGVHVQVSVAIKIYHKASPEEKI